MSDIRFTEGILNFAQAARHLRIPRQTFHRWARGYSHGGPLLHLANSRPDALPVTFIALAEAYVLEALRTAGVRPQRIRPALEALQEEFGREYVLVAPELATDGVDVLWDFNGSKAGHGLIVDGTNQHVIREIVADHMQYVAFGSDGYPEQLQLAAWLPSKVVVDMRRAFGQPIFAGTGTRVADVAGMIKAGENAETVADEFGISVNDVRTSARILLGVAA